MGIMPPEVVPWAALAIMTSAVLGLLGIRDHLVSLGAFVAALVVGAVITTPALFHLNADQTLLTLLLSVGGCAAGAIIGISIKLFRRDKSGK